MSVPDPVAARRARLARGVKLAKRAGYGALLVAIVAFALGLATGFPAALVGLSIGGLIASCVVLPVPIVMGYGIRAAERDDRRAAGRPRPDSTEEPNATPGSGTASGSGPTG